MNRNSKKLTLLSVAVLVLALTATAIRTAACFLDMDFVFDCFTDTTLVLTANIIIGIACVLSFAYLWLHKPVDIKLAFNAPSTYIPTGICGVALAFISVSLFHEVFYDIFDTFRFPNLLALNYLLPFLCCILALVSIVHFFLNAYITEEHDEFRAYFAVATVAFFALYAGFLRLETSLPINSPNKITDEIAFIFVALFFLYEARISLGREKMKFYCSFGLATAALCAYSSIPSIIVYFAKGELISHSIEENILLLSVFIFIVSRIVIAIRLRERKQTDLVCEIDGMASERVNEVLETEQHYSDVFKAKEAEIEKELGNLEDDTDDILESELVEFPKAVYESSEGFAVEVPTHEDSEDSEDSEKIENSKEKEVVSEEKEVVSEGKEVVSEEKEVVFEEKEVVSEDKEEAEEKAEDVVENKAEDIVENIGSKDDEDEIAIINDMIKEFPEIGASEPLEEDTVVTKEKVALDDVGEKEKDSTENSAEPLKE